jgi:tRNA pseudouridine38-40 synthase
MPRYKLTIEYDGTDLVGWQRQLNGLSVQEIIECAVERLTGAISFVQCAGRTDSGVHATGQVAHVDLARAFEPSELQGALNYHIGDHAVAILAVEIADDGFHARLSACRRTYLYRILNRRAPPAIDRQRVWSVKAPLDAVRMQEAAQSLVGHHDFSTFRAASCQAKSPLKTLDVLSVTRIGEEIHIVAEARSFLYHQVRNMVGTLQLVGLGRWPVNAVAEALEARSRSAGGPTAPPQGLYLTGVYY